MLILVPCRSMLNTVACRLSCKSVCSFTQLTLYSQDLLTLFLANKALSREQSLACSTDALIYPLRLFAEGSNLVLLLDNKPVRVELLLASTAQH